jgi:hypothetical protein
MNVSLNIGGSGSDALMSTESIAMHFMSSLLELLTWAQTVFHAFEKLLDEPSTLDGSLSI